MEQADRALDELCLAVQDAQQLLDKLLTRAAVLREERERGRTYGELVEEAEHPLVVEMLTAVLDELAASGSAFRRAEARALAADGFTQDRIAALFGVTRQRVSVLLKEPRRISRSGRDA
jgi:hypothetical protein